MARLLTVTNEAVPVLSSCASRKMRARAGLTQQQAARLLSRPQSFVSKCESGERRVDFVELQFFAKAYKKALDFWE